MPQLDEFKIKKFQDLPLDAKREIGGKYFDNEVKPYSKKLATLPKEQQEKIRSAFIEDQIDFDISDTVDKARKYVGLKKVTPQNINDMKHDENSVDLTPVKLQEQDPELSEALNADTGKTMSFLKGFTKNVDEYSASINKGLDYVADTVTGRDTKFFEDNMDYWNKQSKLNSLETSNHPYYNFAGQMILDPLNFTPAGIVSKGQKIGKAGSLIEKLAVGATKTKPRAIATSIGLGAGIGAGTMAAKDYGNDTLTTDEKIHSAEVGAGFVAGLNGLISAFTKGRVNNVIKPEMIQGAKNDEDVANVILNNADAMGLSPQETEAISGKILKGKYPKVPNELKIEQAGKIKPEDFDVNAYLEKTKPPKLSEEDGFKQNIESNEAPSYVDEDGVVVLGDKPKSNEVPKVDEDTQAWQKLSDDINGKEPAQEPVKEIPLKQQLLNAQSSKANSLRKAEFEGNVNNEAGANAHKEDAQRYDEEIQKIQEKLNANKVEQQPEELQPTMEDIEKIKEHPRYQELLDMRRDVSAKDAKSPQRTLIKGAVRELDGYGGENKHTYDKALYEKNYANDFELTKSDIKKIESGNIDNKIYAKLETDLSTLDNHPDYAEPTKAVSNIDYKAKIKELDDTDMKMSDDNLKEADSFFANGGKHLAVGIVTGTQNALNTDGTLEDKENAFIEGLFAGALGSKVSVTALKKFSPKLYEKASKLFEDEAKSGKIGMFVGSKPHEMGAFSDVATKKSMREISDAEAKIKATPKELNKQKDNIHWDNLTNIKEQYNNGSFSKEQAMKLFEETKSKMSNSDNGTHQLDDVLVHKELFKKYPTISDTKVTFIDMPKNQKGYYDTKANEIVLDSKMDKDEIKDTLLHEIQHAIQKKEGFAKGGSTDNIHPKDMYETIISKYGNLPAIEKIENDFLNSKIPTENEMYEKVINMASNNYGGIEKLKYDTYKRLHGEQQARATQYRKYMTPEQRAKESWQDTLKRVEGEYKEPIVKYGDGVQEQAKVLEDAYLDKNGRVKESNLIKDAVELPKPLNKSNFAKQFNNKKNVTLETPAGNVNFNVTNVYKHFTDNTYFQDRYWLTGAFKDTLQDPLFIVKNPIKKQVEYYKPFRDKNGIVHYIDIVKGEDGNFKHITAFDKEPAQIKGMIKSTEGNLLYYKNGIPARLENLVNTSDAKSMEKDSVLRNDIVAKNNENAKGILARAKEKRETEGLPEKGRKVYHPLREREYYLGDSGTVYFKRGNGKYREMPNEEIRNDINTIAEIGTNKFKAQKLAQEKDLENSFKNAEEVQKEDGYKMEHTAPTADEVNSRADDVTNSFSDDIYSKDAQRLHGHGSPKMDKESVEVINKVKNNPDAEVTIYRAIPKDVDAGINSKDWVTISKEYARTHGENVLNGNYKIVEKKVKAKDLWTDGNSIHEWGYDPHTEPTKLMANGMHSMAGGFASGADSLINQRDYNNDGEYDYRDLLAGITLGVVGINVVKKIAPELFEDGSVGGFKAGAFGGESAKAAAKKEKEIAVMSKKLQQGKLENVGALPDETYMQIAKRLFQDKYSRVEQLIKTKADIDTIDNVLNPYLAEEQMHGIISYKIEKFNADIFSPIIEKIAKTKIKGRHIDSDDVDMYLWARHAIERNKKMLELRLEDTPAATMNEEKVSQVLLKYKDSGVEYAIKDAKKNKHSFYGKFSQKNVDEFLEAKKAQKINAKRAKIIESSSALSGMSDEEAAKIIKKYATPEMEEIANMVYKMNRDRLKLIADSGLETKEFIEAIEKAYDNYVPLRREFENHEALGKRAKGFNISGREFKKAKGSERKVESPLTHSALAYKETIQRVEKNEVGKTFLNFVKEFPDESIYRVLDVKSKPVLDKNGAFVGRDSKYKLADNVLHVKVDGKIKEIEIYDTVLANAMKGLNTPQTLALLKPLRPVMRYLSAISTMWDPEFTVSNFTRDIQTALVNRPDEVKIEKLTFFKSVFSAMKDVYREERGKNVGEWGKLYREMKSEGGTTGWSEMYSVEDMLASTRNAIKEHQGGRLPAKHFKNFLKWVDDLNGAVENSTRLVMYKMAKESGINNRKAANIAKNITVNFNKQGEWGTNINLMFIFFNASVQGSARLVEQLKKSKTSQAIAGGIAAGGFALDQYNRSVNEDAYSKIPNYIKDTNYIIMNEDGSYEHIRLPYGYNVFKSVGDLASAFYEGDITTEKMASRLLSISVNAFSPIGVDTSDILHTITPTILKPAYEIETNKNFFGGKIRPDDNPYGPDTPDSQKYFKSVNPFAKSIAETINEHSGGTMSKSGYVDISPETIEYITGVAGGGLGKLIMRTGTTIDSLITGKKVDVNKVPFLRTVYSTPREKEELSLVYKMAKESATHSFTSVERKRYSRWLNQAVIKKDIDRKTYYKLKKSFYENQRKIDFEVKYNIQNKKDFIDNADARMGAAEFGLTRSQRKSYEKR